MTDSACKRAGYDDTGKYHVPPLKSPTQSTPDVGDIYPPDQCPECRCPPDADHNRECSHAEALGGLCGAAAMKEAASVETPINIPWEVQQELFDLHASQALAALPGYLHLHADEIMAMASARMESGYHQYGSTMFGYDPETRLRNILEELADCVCYLVSGPVP